jgi:hypothetical protein
VYDHWINHDPRLSGQGRRPLDLAEGIVMALRRCDSAAAFDELIGVANDHGVPLLALASALVDVVGGAGSPVADDAVYSAVASHWGTLLAGSAVST